MPDDEAKNPDPLLNSADAAAYLGVTEAWVRRARCNKKLDCVKVGHHTRYRRSVLDAFIEANTDVAGSR
ncbi:helix-turn-helix domain-containing protein [Egicoccus halophilus]|uniref:Helix-turn-helix domain-containing protein n=1 Tax=Egicoccus halophilus TaxID=1670830 RepID=A0A8J3AAY5_9ACTN|nr:helix-turn-helix domain-containing protein [Egicoccus halophilus]GGI09032.1 hypothetical protein GCM10011354_32050 [Egicoccus halophilus]